MWIERIDFAGFGDISGEKIEFSNNKLNLIIEPNNYGKSTVANAIWAILYGFPTQATGALSELDGHRPSKELKVPFIASVDINSGGRRLKIIRDFSDNAVQVIDIGQANKDVTREFRSSAGIEQVGARILGMTREMFRSICFVGQNGLANHAVAGHKDCAALFKSIANSATTATSAGSAIEIIDSVLASFPYKSGAQPVDVLLQNLESRQGELNQRIDDLQVEKNSLTAVFQRIDELEQNIQNETAQAAQAPAATTPTAPTPADEYFALCLEAADLDNQLIRAQERFGKAQDPSRARSKAKEVDRFPIDAVKSVEDLWTRRASRKTDYHRLFEDVSPRIREYDTQERGVREKWDGADKFSLEEGQQIGVLALTLRSAQQDVEDLNKRRKAEIAKLEGQEIDFSRIESARKQILAIDARDFDDARSYVALLTSFQDGIADAEKSIWRSNMIVSELDEQKKAKKGIFPLPGGRKKEQIAAEQEVEKQNARIADLKTKIVGLEVRLDGLARKSGMTDGKQLVTQLREYSSSADKLKDLDKVDQMVAKAEANVILRSGDLEGYFKRAGRRARGLTADTALALADDIKRYHDETKNMNNAFNAVNQARQQLDFLVGEINDIEDFLIQIFATAEMSDLDNVENSYQEYQEKLAEHRKQQSDVQLASNQELLAEMNRLELNRSTVWSSMQELVDKYPEIADTAPPVVAKPAAVSEQSKRILSELRSEREQLLSKLRKASLQHDEKYLPAIEEQEQVWQDLHKIRRAKAALELARNTLRKLSGAGQSDWSVRLNEAAQEIVQDLGTSFDQLQFDADLQVSAVKKGAGTIGTGIAASSLANGLTRQMHLIARLVMTRFLSQESPLPLILDEPFNDFDDERFLKFTQFLLEKSPADNQIIIFSCHRIRHQWLLSQLNDVQKAKLAFVRRASLRPAPKG